MLLMFCGFCSTIAELVDDKLKVFVLEFRIAIKMEKRGPCQIYEIYKASFEDLYFY